MNQGARPGYATLPARSLGEAPHCFSIRLMPRLRAGSVAYPGRAPRFMHRLHLIDRGIHPMRNVRIPMIILSSFSILFGVWPAPNAAAPIKALRFGKLIDGAGKTITNAVVVIENDRIRTVSSDGSSIPAG